jgi:hypothetical protein
MTEAAQRKKKKWYFTIVGDETRMKPQGLVTIFYFFYPSATLGFLRVAEG